MKSMSNPIYDLDFVRCAPEPPTHATTPLRHLNRPPARSRHASTPRTHAFRISHSHLPRTPSPADHGSRHTNSAELHRKG